MKIYDPLYGAFSLPSGFERLILAPEVRRLSAIRLLNTNSPTFATLGDLRRYSHTLGVLRLCLESRLDAFSDAERTALLAAVLVHDVGTPPFGHLFEMLIREREGWDHEAAARRILLGNSVPENSAHLIFRGHGVSFRRELSKVGVDEGIVRAIVSKKHPLSKLIFGSLDLDNLDNVTRMAWALGLESDPANTLDLARELSVSASGELMLDESFSEPVERWLSIRRSVYELLFTDESTVAAQAILSGAMEQALDADELGYEDWSLTDEDCLMRLRQCLSVDTKKLETFFGVLPALDLGVQIRAGTKLDFLTRRQILDCLYSSSEVVAVRGGLAYLARDRKTMSRRLEFVDPKSNRSWSVGQDTSSLFIYHFSDGRSRRGAIGKPLLQAFLRSVGLGFGDVLGYTVGQSWEKLDEQAFNLAP